MPADLGVSRSAWSPVSAFPDLRDKEDVVFMAALERRGVPTSWADAARGLHEAGY